MVWMRVKTGTQTAAAREAVDRLAQGTARPVVPFSTSQGRRTKPRSCNPTIVRDVLSRDGRRRGRREI